MSFVIYDVETTGLKKSFDQIVQFAAIRTDSTLKITDEFQIRCRLMPHVIPSPEAMHVTGLLIDQLLDTSLPSHYAMVTEVRRTLESWCPSLFLGYNSLSFDEEFLRQAFYQCLYRPYLTNTRGSARADVLNLCRLTAALRPDVVTPAIDEYGRTVFKLKALAEANGIAPSSSHNAMADVSTTLELCKLIRHRAPRIWSQFLRFSQKASVESFITEEDAFLIWETFGNNPRVRIVTPIGKNSELAIRYYCLDVSADLDTLREMSDDALLCLCRKTTRPTVTVRTNAAPTLWALYDATQEHLAPFENEDEVLERVAQLQEDRPFLERIRQAAQASEPTYPPSPHVEEQIYGHGFPSPQDEALMQRLHAVPWEERPELALQISDTRYRRLALRLIYLEQPNLLDTKYRCAVGEEVRKRLLPPLNAVVPWRSIPAAQQELKTLLTNGLEGDDLANQLQYSEYLKERANTLTRRSGDTLIF
ncbi:MAG: exonuclease domain-containing protein [Gemmatimonadota bacterium]|nr:exonuclease domain-containing protein [Gemmatimonadota bacterium]